MPPPRTNRQRWPTRTLLTHRSGRRNQSHRLSQTRRLNQTPRPNRVRLIPLVCRLSTPHRLDQTCQLSQEHRMDQADQPSPTCRAAEQCRSCPRLRRQSRRDTHARGPADLIPSMSRLAPALSASPAPTQTPKKAPFRLPAKRPHPPRRASLIPRSTHPPMKINLLI